MVPDQEPPPSSMRGVLQSDADYQPAISSIPLTTVDVLAASVVVDVPLFSMAVPAAKGIQVEISPPIEVYTLAAVPDTKSGSFDQASFKSEDISTATDKRTPSYDIEADSGLVPHEREPTSPIRVSSVTSARGRTVAGELAPAQTGAASDDGNLSPAQSAATMKAVSFVTSLTPTGIQSTTIPDVEGSSAVAPELPEPTTREGSEASEGAAVVDDEDDDDDDDRNGGSTAEPYHLPSAKTGAVLRSAGRTREATVRDCESIVTEGYKILWRNLSSGNLRFIVIVLVEAGMSVRTLVTYTKHVGRTRV